MTKMQTNILEAQTREPLSRGKLNGLRAEHWIPAILYGRSEGKKKSQGANPLLKVNEKTFLKVMGTQKSSNLILQLKWDGKDESVIIKEIQRDPVSRKLIHIDFQKILMSEKLEVSVSIRITGEAPGVKLSGGILQHITRDVRILSLPKDIPSEIAMDVSTLEIGHAIYVKDLKEIPGVKILTDPNLMIVNVVAPTVLEEVVPGVPAAGPAEPEVIAKGKKPEEEGEAAAAPAAKAPVEKGAAAPPAKGAQTSAGK